VPIGNGAFPTRSLHRCAELHVQGTWFDGICGDRYPHRLNSISVVSGEHPLKCRYVVLYHSNGPWLPAHHWSVVVMEILGVFGNPADLARGTRDSLSSSDGSHSTPRNHGACICIKGVAQRKSVLTQVTEERRVVTAEPSMARDVRPDRER
jgi:hypothetical protein